VLRVAGASSVPAPESVSSRGELSPEAPGVAGTAPELPGATAVGMLLLLAWLPEASEEDGSLSGVSVVETGGLGCL
jgi:hypothetical protein